MRILIAGATGVLGLPLARALREAGHEVVGTSRTAARAARLSDYGIVGAVMDAFDEARVHALVRDVAPDAVIHQLTDLASIDTTANAHLRTVGTRQLVDAALAAGVRTMVTQSIAWAYQPGTAPADERTPLDRDSAEPRATTVAGVAALESAVAEIDRSVVLRFGTLYGPGTWYAFDGAIAERARDGQLIAVGAITCFLHVDDAVSAAVQALGWPDGPVNVVDDHPARDTEWMPLFCRRVGAGAPRTDRTAASTPSRPADNSYAHRLGWHPRYPEWSQALGR